MPYAAANGDGGGGDTYINPDGGGAGDGVLCSATILALNSFEHFRRQVGLQNNDGTQYQKVDSPFDYQNNAQLIIAKMKNEPSSQQFTDELITELPALINQSKACLVLFSSYWQMEQVAKALRDEHKMDIEVQGEQSRQHIIEAHKKRCDGALSAPPIHCGRKVR